MKQARLLVLRGGALGDFLVTLPALAALRDRWPDGYIELVGYPNYTELARMGGLVSHTRSLHGAQIARLFSLRPEFPPEQVAWIRSFDFILSYLHDPDGTVVNNLYLAGARTVLYGSPMVQARHAIDQMMRPLESLAIYAAGAAARLRLPDPMPPEPRCFDDIGPGHPPYAVLHPGSGSPGKNAPLPLFLEIGARLRAERGIQPLYIAGEADGGVAEQLKRSAPPAPLLEDRSLPEVAALLAGASFYMGNDSGITHLAAASGAPVLALFGPSDPALWGPRGDNVRILRAPGGEWDRLNADHLWAAVSISG